MNRATLKTIDFDGRKIDYRLVCSESARKLRVRVGLNGIEVVQPIKRDTQEIETFLKASQEWIINQLERVERFRPVRKPLQRTGSEILYRGVTTPVRVEYDVLHKSSNKVIFENGILTVIHGPRSCTSAAKSLENWLRKQARQELYTHLKTLTEKLGKHPHKVYVMGQRTKWGNCSSLQNLSFNWRLIMAPDFVIRYLVTHEVVHLKVHDHSQRFWLTLQSLCPEMDRARQWLCANSDRMMTDMRQV